MPGTQDALSPHFKKQADYGIPSYLLKSGRQGTEEMAQRITLHLCKQEDLNLYPWNPFKKLGTAAHSCSLSTRDRGRKITGACELTG